MDLVVVADAVADQMGSHVAKQMGFRGERWGLLKRCFVFVVAEYIAGKFIIINMFFKILILHKCSKNKHCCVFLRSKTTIFSNILSYYYCYPHPFY